MPLLTSVVSSRACRRDSGLPSSDLTGLMESLAFQASFARSGIAEIATPNLTSTSQHGAFMGSCYYEKPMPQQDCTLSRASDSVTCPCHRLILANDAAKRTGFWIDLDYEKR